MTKQLSQRKSFSERNGFKEPSIPLNPENISYELRLELEDILTTESQEGLWKRQLNLKKPDWEKLLGDMLVCKFRHPRNQGSTALCLDLCKGVIRNHNFYEVFDLLEEVAERLGNQQPSFQDRVNESLTRNNASYIFHQASIGSWMIIATGSGKEREAVLQSFADITDPAFNKTMEHFEKAGHRLAKGEFPESTGQTVKALESCLKKLTNKPDLTGGQALEIYAKENHLSPRLKQLMQSVWQYRNEAEDVGHSKRDNPTSPSPDRWEAQLLYVVTAGCLSYLVNKKRESEITTLD